MRLEIVGAVGDPRAGRSRLARVTGEPGPRGGRLEAEPVPPELAAVPARFDEAALVELFREHQLGLVRLALLLVGDQPTAEDVVQEVFATMHRRLDRLEGVVSARAYVHASVVNACRMVLRRRAVTRRLGVTYEAPVWSAESAAMLGEDRREVLLALRDLPRRQREALVLRFYLDLSEAEIAQAMGISRGTVKSTTSRALAALATRLGGKS